MATSTSSPILQLRRQLATVLIGQEKVVDRMLIGLLTGGHLLLEGVPGVAKTLAARLLAQGSGLRFQRVQFTPDLLPADLVGTEIFHPGSGEFSTRQGPVFTQVLLADEINRAPAKVQSALLEAMQEKQVTIGPESHALPEPFLVIATQNPLEHEGTFPLPEAQVDRFLMKVLVGYPDRADERRVVRQMGVTDPLVDVEPVLDAQAIGELRRQVDAVHLEDRLLDYILDVISATRQPSRFNLDLDQFIELGASPRAGIALVLAAKGMAVLQGRDFVLPEDVKEVGNDVLRHRVLLTFEAEAEDLDADAILDQVFAEITVP